MRTEVSRIRQHVAVLRSALMSPSPDEIEKCLPALAEAAGCLSSVTREQTNLHPELIALRQDLRLVSKLIEHGAAFYDGWAKLLGAAIGGYTPSGEAAPLTATAAVIVRG